MEALQATTATPNHGLAGIQTLTKDIRQAIGLDNLPGSTREMISAVTPGFVKNFRSKVGGFFKGRER